MGLESLGYKLSSEEFGGRDLVRLARRAEEAGFEFAAISDHFHPWTEGQGNSPFVWSVLGALSEATERMRFLTAVSCPTIRMHPAIVAHAAVTAAELLPNRFALGLGTGENLNEHVLGDRWPPAAVRREMLSEAIDVIRMLLTGTSRNHRGTYYTVENAFLHSKPEQPPPILVAASGPKAIELAAEKSDGLIALAPESAIVERFDAHGGSGKPRYCEINVCWADDRQEALQKVPSLWPIAGLPGELSQELALPRHFEQAAQNVTPDDIEGKVACGPDPEEHLDSIRRFLDAGYTHVWIHQIGPEQDGFIDFYESQIVPKL